MDSRNHIMFGSVGAYLYSHLLGVRPLAPGYTQLRVQPAIVTHPDLTHASGTVWTPLGDVVVSWATAPPPLLRYGLNVTVPPGAWASVEVACDAGSTMVTESGAPVWRAGRAVLGVPGIEGAAVSAFGHVDVQVVSGAYAFECRK